LQPPTDQGNLPTIGKQSQRGSFANACTGACDDCNFGMGHIGISWKMSVAIF
jgi:hypothetical protein